ncbi:hypothetical protein [Mycoplasma simbae]|uniref:hypothetical protein n=1 Tax=Mycoplasma simbae TaxID=36744 RepID=UPI0004985B49|nr:hypothetical protein [Mycoplasma simbae]
MDNIEIFMYIFMYKLEQYLINKKADIINLAFQIDEANTDRSLKEFLKYTIENEFHNILGNINDLSINVNGVNYNLSNFNVQIIRVILPEEIDIDLKKKLRNNKNNSVYTDPDICLEIVIAGEIYYQTVELKSTKNNSIPGSSVQQIKPTEWVIFVKHSGENIEISTGMYVNSINSKMQFPDRSPRPQVSFNELNKWNKKNRKLIGSTLYYNNDENEVEKYAFITDWQSFLSDKWLQMLIKSTKIKPNEPWFNNNMRKFIIKFLEYYDSLSNYDKEELKKDIEELITEDTY